MWALGLALVAWNILGDIHTVAIVCLLILAKCSMRVVFTPPAVTDTSEIEERLAELAQSVDALRAQFGTDDSADDDFD
jgi:hypothetical protein